MRTGDAAEQNYIDQIEHKRFIFYSHNPRTPTLGTTQLGEASGGQSSTPKHIMNSEKRKSGHASVRLWCTLSSYTRINLI
jgi:hypothetical protein